MTKLPPMDPEVKRFIDEVINAPGSNATLAQKKFSEIVDHAKANGYNLTDTDLLNGLNKYFENEISLPYWLEKRVGGLAIWAAWEDRG